METKLDDIIYETRHNFEVFDNRFDYVDKCFEKMDKRFEKMDDRFEKINEQLFRLYDLVNAQVWNFFLGISFVAITLKLIDKLWP